MERLVEFAVGGAGTHCLEGAEARDDAVVVGAALALQRARGAAAFGGAVHREVVEAVPDDETGERAREGRRARGRGRGRGRGRAGWAPAPVDLCIRAEGLLPRERRLQRGGVHLDLLEAAPAVARTPVEGPARVCRVAPGRARLHRGWRVEVACRAGHAYAYDRALDEPCACRAVRLAGRQFLRVAAARGERCCCDGHRGGYCDVVGGVHRRGKEQGRRQSERAEPRHAGRSVTRKKKVSRHLFTYVDGSHGRLMMSTGREARSAGTRAAPGA